MHKRFLALLALASLAAFAGCTTTRKAQPLALSATPGAQTPQHFQKQFTHTARLEYLLFLPSNYTSCSSSR